MQSTKFKLISTLGFINPASFIFDKKSLRLGLSLLILSLQACGGGGGGGDGGDFVGAAKVFLQASPTTIDTADQMLVSVHISEVNDSGIALKLKFPEGLSYVPSSSSLIVDGESIDISPAVNAGKDDSIYLVYYLDQKSFGKDAQGSVEFLLEGVSKFSDGTLEVDADVDNPLVDNSVEFDIENPGFAAEDSVDVNVEG